MLDLIARPEVVQVIGLLASLLVLFSAAGSFASWLVRQRRRRAAYRLERQELQQRIERAHWATQRARSLSEWRWEGQRKFELVRKIGENGDESIRSFYFKPHDNRPLPEYKPGQYLTLRLKIPGQAKPVVRCYSLSDKSPGHGDEQVYRITVKKLWRGICSSYLHDTLRVGDLVDLDSPRGAFFLDLEHSWPAILLGAGVGVTPLLSMLEAVAGSRYRDRGIWLFYGVRDLPEMIQRARIEEIARTTPYVRVVFCYSQPSVAAKKLIAASEASPPSAVLHRAGRIDLPWLFSEVLTDSARDLGHFYTCGPPSMMDEVDRHLDALGVDKERRHSEAFGPASVPRTKRVELAESKVGFAVQFARSQRTAQWTGEHSNLLELAEQHNIDIAYGCRVGQCGDCAVAVRAGRVEYANEPAAEIAPGTCLTCQSVPASDVVLDA